MTTNLKYQFAMLDQSVADGELTPREANEAKLELEEEWHMLHPSPDCQCNICTYGREAPCFANEY
jgi:hypothetical protein